MIEITQTCAKCKSKRELTTRASQGGTLTITPQDGGWRQFGNKWVCPTCINEFLGEAL